jgi:protein TonB
MATPSAGLVPERRRICTAAGLALIVEAVLACGGYLMLEHKPTPPVVPPVTLLSIAPAPAPEPKQTPPAPLPQAKALPQPVARPAVPTHHETHAARPRPMPQPPPVPTPTPEPAARTTTPATTSPAPVAPPPAAPPAAPAAPDPSFESALRAAIQAALRYPESARMAGMAGRTRVAFQYRDGAVSDVTLVTSSGSAMLDRAALAAVQDAAYPKPESSMVGKTLNERLWVTFNLDANE